jgi:hypothetical protein
MQHIWWECVLDPNCLPHGQEAKERKKKQLGSLSNMKISQWLSPLEDSTNCQYCHPGVKPLTYGCGGAFLIQTIAPLIDKTYI